MVSLGQQKFTQSFHVEGENTQKNSSQNPPGVNPTKL